MSLTYDVILKSGTLVNHDGTGVRDIAVINGRVAAIGSFAPGSAAEVIDCKGLHILPGVIDTQVHFREPGLTHKEDLETGSRSAAMGGVTAVFEMPNTDPLTVTEQTFSAKLKRGRHRMHCDFAFFIGGTRDNVEQLPELERAPGCAGVKVFIGSSTGALLVEDDESLRQILQVIRRRAALHAEDEHRLNERKELRIDGDPRSHPASPSGMTGVQTLVPVMLNHVSAGRLSPARFVDLTSAGPARLFNIACKGRIAAGYDADFTVVDLKRSETITDEWVASRAGWTPYHGVRVTGWPVGTFVRGKRVMWQGELVASSTGEPVRVLETLKA